MAIDESDYQYSVKCTKFSGLYQGGDGYNIGLEYAVGNSYGFDCTDGRLSPLPEPIQVTPGRIIGSDPNRAHTLMAVNRRYQWDAQGTVTVADIDYYLCAAGTKLYMYDTSAATPSWQQISGITITNDVFDWITYEVNQYTEPGETEPTATPEAIDVLLFTNADDGMFIFYSHNQTVEAVTIQPDPDQDPLKFGMLTRHYERIWGSGVKNYPDTLFYSAPNDPLDWAQAEIPADGGGQINQPTWDGDRFTALKTYGTYVLAFKKDSAWKIIGTDPSEYTMKEQFGGGTIYENTVAVHNDTIIMLGYNGLMYYNGASVAAFQHSTIRDLIASVNQSAINKAVACVCNDIYYLALPTGTGTHNAIVIEYSFRDSSFAVRRLDGEYIDCDSFLVWKGKVYCMGQYTDEYGYLYGFCMNLLTHGDVSDIAHPYSASGNYYYGIRYETAWQDLGYRNVTKSAFDLYLLCDSTQTISVSVKTEKGIKTKTVSLTANKPKKIHLSNRGRFFKFIFSTTSGTTYWTLSGGYSCVMELDWD